MEGGTWRWKLSKRINKTPICCASYCFWYIYCHELSYGCILSRTLLKTHQRDSDLLRELLFPLYIWICTVTNSYIYMCIYTCIYICMYVCIYTGTYYWYIHHRLWIYGLLAIFPTQIFTRYMLSYFFGDFSNLVYILLAIFPTLYIYIYFCIFCWRFFRLCIYIYIFVKSPWPTIFPRDSPVCFATQYIAATDSH